MNELYDMAENTFFMDFSMADVFGANAVKDTYKRAFNEWKDDYKMLTALVVTLNHKIWQHYEAGNNKLALVYDELWKEADQYACDTLKDEALKYFLEVTD